MRSGRQRVSVENGSGAAELEGEKPKVASARLRQSAAHPGATVAAAAE